MKKIIFGITSLTLGGAEKVLVDIVNKLSSSYEIDILVLYPNGEFEKQVDKKTKIINIFEKPFKEYNKVEKLMISLKLLNPFTKRKIFNKYVKNKYDSEIAFLEGPITNLFSISKGNNIAWIHNDINQVFGKGIKAYLKKINNKKIYKKYKKLIFVSRDNMEKFNNLYKNNIPKKVIYNYLNSEYVLNQANEKYSPEFDEKTKNFVIVARLTEQKGILRFIDVHKKLIDNGYFHKVYLIGEGLLKEEIDLKLKKLNISTFIMLGKKENPYPFIKKSDGLILPSLFEGYGMVLVEAIILNKKILTTDTAAREAVIGYPNALIVKNNEQGLYEGMIKFIKSDKTIIYNYKNDNILSEIINIIEE